MIVYIAIVYPLVLLAAGVFGYYVLGPWTDGYKAFTSPTTAAEDRVFGWHPERRTRRWKP